MSAIDRLTDDFSRLPGIGSKTALRLVHHLIGNKRRNKSACRALIDLADKVRACDVCGNFSEQEKCEICEHSTRRDPALCR